jgi:hypothetical protein
MSGIVDQDPLRQIGLSRARLAFWLMIGNPTRAQRAERVSSFIQMEREAERRSGEAAAVAWLTRSQG